LAYRRRSDNATLFLDQVDTWDRNGKLWKLQFIPRGATTAIPADLTGTNSSVTTSGGELGLIYDIQGNHASIASPGSPPALNSVVPKDLHDVSLYGLPDGLNQIMRSWRFQGLRVRAGPGVSAFFVSLFSP